MVSKKHRNKTRKIRGGGGCVSKGCAVETMSNINVVKAAANKIKSNARTARERNNAEKKAAKKAESDRLREDAEKHAGEYANSEVKRLEYSGNDAKTYRGVIYSNFIMAFNMKIMDNIMNGRPQAEGVDEFFESYGKPTEFSNENMKAELGELNRYNKSLGKK